MNLIGKKIKHFEVKELIGRGAMGSVYRAYDKSLERDVAIKFLSSETLPASQQIERFYREARAAAGLAHPNVIVIHDVGEFEGTCYFVMELLPGNSLRHMIREGRRPDWKEGLKIIDQVCRALEAAHRLGLLHRDIKADNVWLMPDGHCKVLDFGIARFSAAQSLTRTGETLGTPEYMAPEQIMGDQLDDRADVYAVGILMYELFTGQLPFYGPNAITVIYKQMEEDPTPPGKLSDDLPEAVEKIILKAMNKDPGQRYSSAKQMRIEIEAILEGRPIESEFKGDPESLTAGKKPGLKERGGGRFECRLVGREDEMKALKASLLHSRTKCNTWL